MTISRPHQEASGKPRWAALVWLVVAVSAACGNGAAIDPAPEVPPTTQPSATETVAPLPQVPNGELEIHIDPVHQPNGNRLVEGSGLATGFVQQVTTKDIDLGGIPTWVTGASTPDGDVWVVAMNDGTVRGYRIPIGGQPSLMDIPGNSLDPDQPLVLIVQGNSVRLATTPANASPDSVPVYLAGGRAAYIDNLQRFTVLEAEGTLWRPDLEVLPDSRIIQLSGEQVMVLAEPTDRYPHSALGDNLEATSLVVVTVGVNEVETIYQSGDEVIESIAPLLADVDGDGTDDVALVVSNDREVWIVVASSAGGGIVATSDPVDRLLGWRHLLAVGPLGPNGQIEIAETLYPDGQGEVRFLGLRGANLAVLAARSGYRSHEFGSRNLEQALAADLDRDGHIEVIVPTFDRQGIAGVRHGPDGAAEMWNRPLGGTLSTNIAVLVRPDGTLSVAAATQQGALRVWQ